MTPKIALFFALAALLCMFQLSFGASTDLSSQDLQDRLCAMDSQYCEDAFLLEEYKHENDVDETANNDLLAEDDEDDDETDLAANENTDVEARARRRLTRRRGRKGRKGRKGKKTRRNRRNKTRRNRKTTKRVIRRRKPNRG